MIKYTWKKVKKEMYKLVLNFWLLALRNYSEMVDNDVRELVAEVEIGKSVSLGILIVNSHHISKTIVHCSMAMRLANRVSIPSKLERDLTCLSHRHATDCCREKPKNFKRNQPNDSSLISKPFQLRTATVPKL